MLTIAVYPYSILGIIVELSFGHTRYPNMSHCLWLSRPISLASIVLVVASLDDDLTSVTYPIGEFGRSLYDLTLIRA